MLKEQAVAAMQAAGLTPAVGEYLRAVRQWMDDSDAETWEAMDAKDDLFEALTQSEKDVANVIVDAVWGDIL